MFNDADITELLRQYPPVDYAIAYGSGVLQQSNYDYTVEDSKLPMIDIIFAVSDAKRWHMTNMAINPSHYSSDIPLSPSNIAYIQENIGAGLWYNTYIPINIRAFPNRQIKYGVISTHCLMEDLTEWKYLYAAGRLHKPVLVMKTNESIEDAVAINRLHAVNTSLCLLPQYFSEKELYMTIAALSYNGDPRMLIAENPKKVV